MDNQLLFALRTDVGDLCAGLHVLADAAERRGDDDVRGLVHLLARHAETVHARLDDALDAAVIPTRRDQAAPAAVAATTRA